MAKTSYGEKLRDPRWQRKRLDILQRDNFTCTICLDKETELHIHHKKYVAGCNPWEYENYDLTTLCADCHKLITAHINKFGKQGDFDVMYIRADGLKTSFEYGNETLSIHLPRELNEVCFSPQSLKKVIHFVINNWLKNG